MDAFGTYCRFSPDGKTWSHFYDFYSVCGHDSHSLVVLTVCNVSVAGDSTNLNDLKRHNENAHDFRGPIQRGCYILLRGHTRRTHSSGNVENGNDIHYCSSDLQADIYDICFDLVNGHVLL